jgi:hypothetical protein
MAEHRCRILYSTQSGRAKACARRAARILGCVESKSFDDDMLGTDSLPEYVRRRLRQESQTTLLILFVSTTGDGEHTVRRRRRKCHIFKLAFEIKLLNEAYFEWI